MVNWNEYREEKRIVWKEYRASAWKEYRASAWKEYRGTDEDTADYELTLFPLEAQK